MSVAIRGSLTCVTLREVGERLPVAAFELELRVSFLFDLLPDLFYVAPRLVKVKGLLLALGVLPHRSFPDLRDRVGVRGGASARHLHVICTSM